ncbi:glycosyltransferase family 4 protein [Galbibacter mesophilus]|uniref:glycosyltransferase family 4 protein n=1 Tax=Galbibacter mesophilus TaxID=379069 RepID=UPI00191CD293|nr:glycosyltransferase family 4 protein [Galbibacter mesophilus]MCM5663305.1 glycosyltransferase family 4 protein [Galbibacter mesophilus]
MYKKTALFIGYVWPEPNSSAAGSRMLQLLRFFKEQDYEVVFSSPAKKGTHMFDIESEGIQQKEIMLNNNSFDEFVKELNPAVVIFDRYMMEEQFGWRVAENCPETIRILDTEDLHFLRKERQKALKGKSAVDETSLLKSELAQRELASIYRCDVSLIISEVEMDLLKSTFKVPDELLHYLPFMIDKSNSSNILFEDKEDFIFIGNFLHEPNWDAALALKETVWPLIKKQLPKAKLNIYGAYATEKVYNLHNEKEGFLVHGWAENAEKELSKSRILLAPLRFGAGLKGKLIEAMQVGTPSVTTDVGAEGINGEFNWSGFIFNNPIDFANAAVALYTAEEEFRQAVKNGNRILEMRFDAAVHKQFFKTKLKELQNNLAQHRTENFIGSMLQQQTTQASKYLSKWIEAKNKNS